MEVFIIWCQTKENFCFKWIWPTLVSNRITQIWVLQNKYDISTWWIDKSGLHSGLTHLSEEDSIKTLRIQSCRKCCFSLFCEESPTWIASIPATDMVIHSNWRFSNSSFTCTAGFMSFYVDMYSSLYTCGIFCYKWIVKDMYSTASVKLEESFKRMLFEGVFSLYSCIFGISAEHHMGLAQSHSSQWYLHGF